MTYSDASVELDVEFKDGAVYRFSAVPRLVYDAFLAADSKGAFLNRCIKGRFSYVRVRPARPRM